MTNNFNQPPKVASTLPTFMEYKYKVTPKFLFTLSTYGIMKDNIK